MHSTAPRIVDPWLVTAKTTSSNELQKTFNDDDCYTNVCANQREKHPAAAAAAATAVAKTKHTGPFTTIPHY